MVETLSYEEDDGHEVGHDDGGCADADDGAEGRGGCDVDEADEADYYAHETDGSEGDVVRLIDLLSNGWRSVMWIEEGKYLT